MDDKGLTEFDKFRKADEQSEVGVNLPVKQDFGGQITKPKLTQEIFNGQPPEVDWAGVDYDGLLSFGKATNPRYTWASERWRGFELIGERIENSGYEPLDMIYRKSQNSV